MIDREKVVNAFVLCRVNEGCSTNCPYWDGNTSVKECTKKLAADVYSLLKEQEAKTGYWIDSAGNDKCSICGAEYSDLYPDYGNTHFCPNCGAKMKGQ